MNREPVVLAPSSRPPNAREELLQFVTAGRRAFHLHKFASPASAWNETGVWAWLYYNDAKIAFGMFRQGWIRAEKLTQEVTR